MLGLGEFKQCSVGTSSVGSTKLWEELTKRRHFNETRDAEKFWPMSSATRLQITHVKKQEVGHGINNPKILNDIAGLLSRTNH